MENFLKTNEIDPNGLEQWGENASRRAISIGGEKIGEIELIFHNDGKVHINKIWLFENKRGQGIGMKLYKQIGNELSSEGKTLISGESRTEAGENLWRALIREGYAKVHEPSAGKQNIVYEFIPRA